MGYHDEREVVVHRGGAQVDPLAQLVSAVEEFLSFLRRAGDSAEKDLSEVPVGAAVGFVEKVHYELVHGVLHPDFPIETVDFELVDDPSGFLVPKC